MPKEQPTRALGEETLKALAELATALADQTESADVQRVVLRVAAKLLGTDSGAVATWDDQAKALRPGEVLGRGKVLHEADLFADGAVAPRILARHEGACLNDPAKELRLSPGGVSAIVVVPMASGDRLIGAVAMASTSKGRRFDPADQKLLQVVANITASVLDSTVQFKQFSDDLRLQIVEVTREMNRAMAELAQVKSFNENIFESISMGIVVFDRSFGVIFRNRLADRLLPDDRNVLKALAKTDVESRYEQYETIFRDVVRLGQFCSFDGLRIEGQEDTLLVLRLSASPLVGGRQAIVGGIMTVEDVTRNVTMENRLATSERLAAVGKLAAKVAHELNNPLDGIMRYINLAMRVCSDNQDKRPVRYLEEARTGLLRMARVIGELLEFSRSTNDLADAVTIGQALQDAIKSLAGKAEQQKVELKLNIAADLPALESTSLYQVFTNLIKNAVEAMPEGGIVDVGAIVAAGAVEISVADSGQGIPPKRLATIFEPFYSTKEAGQGTGLGLAICKDIVEKHGGTLVARNRASGGAEFVVRIPTQLVGGETGKPGPAGI